ncbi:mitochondrial cruciform cutting endonuclease 1 [Echria macrotheca]|uniref:Mitochondrial cruciform cutting endonuclease 1 n=1 Tax=Echria macrotheca TaxID=438768 RepID=A0AAJ0BMV2_9PEZI|nr:mitochondrial cruciform cutting endonuclease 1 [Echria macrotheca]
MKIPKNLKLDALQHLAFHCGLSKTGTKQLLAQRLRTTAREYEPLPPDARVLSIDLGLRNFAFSLMTPGPDRRKHGPLIHLHAWQHVNLLLAGSTNKAASSDIESGSPDFSPGIMAQRATELVHDRLLPLRPTHILIERQRWRTAGRPSVQEWTIRVNTLEAMLYGIFATLQARGLWDGKVIPIPPARVVRYLIGDGGMGRDLFSRRKTPLLLEERISTGPETPEVDPVTSSRGRKPTSADAKIEKIRLLQEVLNRGDAIGFITPEADIGRLQFSNEAGAKPSGKKSTKKAAEGVTGVGQEAGNVSRLTKRDDLSDCLFQGVTWLEWQDNIESLRKTHPWVLDDGG